uniref:Uncharacterized protein n=1 Tax=Anguilla anguilla TaxID=7936 RepID=A0A0E9V483_ANGAN
MQLHETPRKKYDCTSLAHTVKYLYERKRHTRHHWLVLVLLLVGNVALQPLLFEYFPFFRHIKQSTRGHCDGHCMLRFRLQAMQAYV